MKYGQPLLTTELSGSMGGATASSARGGVGYFRRRAIPGNPRSTYQSIVRSILTSVAAAWANTLTALQRAGWESISPPESSGIDSYVKYNTQALLGAQARVDDPPTTLALVVDPITVSPIVDASAHTVAFTMPSIASGGDDAAANVYVSAPQKASRASQQFPFRFIGTEPPGNGGAAASIAVPATHPAYNVVAGDVVYVKITMFGAGGAQDGSVGVEQIFRCTVVA